MNVSMYNTNPPLSAGLQNTSNIIEIQQQQLRHGLLDFILIIF